MGKKADALLKVLAERDAEIVRLRQKLNGGVSVRFNINMSGSVSPPILARMEVGTAGDGLYVSIDGQSSIIVNPWDIATITLPKPVMVDDIVWTAPTGGTILGAIIFQDDGTEEE